MNGALHFCFLLLGLRREFRFGHGVDAGLELLLLRFIFYDGHGCASGAPRRPRRRCATVGSLSGLLARWRGGHCSRLPSGASAVVSARLGLPHPEQ